MLSVSGRMSAKTGRAPRSTKALMVDTKVNEGTMTSSSDFASSNKALISRAWVHDVVSKARSTPSVCSSNAWQRLVKAPSPEMCPFSRACAI